jgi:2',3'-cyclic-nucleotide 2'-phosphodiesterase (5'-nucleotidase family)
VFEVNGIRVGVIGVALPKDTEERDPEVWTQAVAQEAERLKEKADLLVVLGHLDSKSCRDLSLRVPAIRVLVGGHSHELITKPIIVEKTGALIVQAGCYAHYVGRVDLTVDLDTKQIAHADGSVVEMRHDTVPCDNALLEWVRQREREVCPEAGRVVAHCEKPVDSIGVGRLAADALRKRAGADIGFCHPGQIIRSGLPAGAIDVNALFVTGGQRGVKIVTAAVTGEAIEKYLKAVKTGAKGDTQWAGFKAELEYASANGGWVVHTDLDPELRYRVVMPEVEWQTRFARRSDKGDKSSNAPRPKACPFSFIDALTAYVEDLDKENVTLDAHVKKLAAAQALKPVPATR